MVFCAGGTCVYWMGVGGFELWCYIPFSLSLLTKTSVYS
jgi:hypothetical protein